MTPRLGSAFAAAASLALSLAASEGVVRLANRSMRNYDIEMWRYARELKLKSPDPLLGHEHRADASAVLQTVEIRTNSWGLRGGPASETPRPGVRRILVLGSSIALGWGVAEDRTVPALLQQRFESAGRRVEVLNAGVGNYNAQRYIELFFARLARLHPSEILVLAFARDAEELKPGGGNRLLRNSELAVSIWAAARRLFGPKTPDELVGHYRKLYEPGAPGLETMRRQFARLGDYARKNHVAVVIALAPDIHELSPYPLGFVDEAFARIARDQGFVFVDLLPALQRSTPQELFAMPGDPHPNAWGHRLMADAIFPFL